MYSNRVLGAVKGAIGTHSNPSDAESWFTIFTPGWVTLSQVCLQHLKTELLKLRHKGRMDCSVSSTTSSRHDQTFCTLFLSSSLHRKHIQYHELVPDWVGWSLNDGFLSRSILRLWDQFRSQLGISNRDFGRMRVWLHAYNRIHHPRCHAGSCYPSFSPSLGKFLLFGTFDQGER